MTARGTSLLICSSHVPRRSRVAIDARHALDAPVRDDCQYRVELGRLFGDAAHERVGVVAPLGIALEMRARTARWLRRRSAPDASIWKSICSAASRPECAAPIVREPCVAESARERDHLDRADRGVPAFVAGFGAGALDGLLDGVGREHAERDRHAGRHRQLRDAFRSLAGDVVEVRRGSADDRAERDDRVDLFARREAARDERDLPCAGHAHDRDVLARGAVAHERVDRALDQVVDDEVVEAARDDGERAPAGDDERAFDRCAA